METNQEPPTSEDKYNKPSYDARQVYYNRIIMPIMEAIVLCQIKKDYPNWLLLIESLYDASNAFLKDGGNVLVELNECYSTLNEYNLFNDSKNQGTASIVFERQLHQLTRTLYKAAKDMLLPVSSETVEEFSWDDFKRQSDL